MSDDLRFPIGKFDPDIKITPGLRKASVQKISGLPHKLEAAVKDLDDAKLDTRYRPGGWTVRQVVHHIADSHINSYCRFKLALTEEEPVIRAYYEDRWAELSDSVGTPVLHSMKIISGIHFRWAALLMMMSDEDFQRKLMHPETGEWRLENMLALYAWHSEHHTAHITELRKRENW